MRAWRRSLPLLTLHLGLGLAWIALLASRAAIDGRHGPAALKIAVMLLLAGWLPGLIQSVSQASWPGLSAWVEVGGIAPFPCPKPLFPQLIST